MEGSYPVINAEEARYWVYPTNYEVREYQRSIAEKCLFSNTLVCLPTGLGKTLIAAVVMHAFYRWYPDGIIVFMAPTKPLVAQQVGACHNVMGIPEHDTARMEGSVSTEKRRELWSTRRMIFCTPQTFQNDIRSGNCPARRVVCLVVDEAHKATRGYAYTNVVQDLEGNGAKFRILGLSATPGSDVKKVQAVINNLRINTFEFRTEDDPDISPYTFQRNVEIVKVAEGNGASVIAMLKQQVEAMMRPVLTRLHQNRMIDNPQLAGANIFLLEEARRNLSQALSERSAFFTEAIRRKIESDVSDLSHMLECRRVIGNSDLPELNQVLRSMSTPGADRVVSALTATPQYKKISDILRKTQNDGASMAKQAPKIEKLKEILSQHFEECAAVGKSSRAIIFAQLRNTVQQIVGEVAESEGISPHEFIGQATKGATSDAEAVKGLTQQRQQEVLAAFNEGVYNVLVATSIAEEGLDIAEVDLIIFFDIVSSPVRMVQRMGRTGRKRDGRILMLLAGAGEVDKYEKGDKASKSLSKAMRNPLDNQLVLRPHLQSMLPPHLPRPRMISEEMQIDDFHLSQVGGAEQTVLDKGGASGGRGGRGSRAVSRLGSAMGGIGVGIRSISTFFPPPGTTSTTITGGGGAPRASPEHNVYADDAFQAYEFHGRGAGEGLTLGVGGGARPRTSRGLGLGGARGAPASGHVFSSSSFLSAELDPSVLGEDEDDDKAYHESGFGWSEPSTAAAGTDNGSGSCGVRWGGEVVEILDSQDSPSHPEEEDHIIIMDTGVEDEPETDTTGHQQHQQQATLFGAENADNKGGTTVHEAGASSMSVFENKKDGDNKRVGTKEPSVSVATPTQPLSSPSPSAPRAHYARLKARLQQQQQEQSEGQGKDMQQPAQRTALSALEALSIKVPPLLDHHQHQQQRRFRVVPPVPVMTGYLLTAAPAPAPAPAHASHADIYAPAPASVSVISGFALADTQPSSEDDECNDEDEGEGEEGAQMECRVGRSPPPPSSSLTSAHLMGFSLPSSQDDSSEDDDDDDEEEEGHGDEYGEEPCSRPAPVSVPPALTFSLPSSQDSDGSDSGSEGGEEEKGSAATFFTHTPSASAAPPPLPATAPTTTTSSSSSSSSSSSTESRRGSVYSAAQSDREESDHMPPLLHWEDSPVGMDMVEASGAVYSDSACDDAGAGVGGALVLREREREEERSRVERSDAALAISLAQQQQQQQCTEQEQEQEQEQERGEEEEEAHCCVCLHQDSLEDNPVIFCEGQCGLAVHQHCYHLHRIPDGPFLCDGCTHASHNKYPQARCVLCNKSSGMLKLSRRKQFFHPMCVRWTAELTDGDDGVSVEPALLDKNRKFLTCQDCGQSGGACVECDYGDCRVAFHPHCAYMNNHLMVLCVNTDESSTVYRLYCDQHAEHASTADYFSSNKAVPAAASASASAGSGGSGARERPCGAGASPGEVVDLSNDSPLLQDTQQSPPALSLSTSSRLANSNSSSHPSGHGVGVGVKGQRPQQRPAAGRAQGLLRLKRARTVESVQGIGGGVSLPEKEGTAEKAQRKAARRAVRASELAKTRRMASKFFEEEASVSGSDSSDNDEEEERGRRGSGRDGRSRGHDGDEDSPQLSGDFINDGEYTQLSPSLHTQSAGKGKGRGHTRVPREGMAMYFHVNQNLGTPLAAQISEGGQRWGNRSSGHARDGSAQRGSGLHFRGAEGGLPHIERILQQQQDRERKREKKKKKKPASDRYDNDDSDSGGFDGEEEERGNDGAGQDSIQCNATALPRPQLQSQPLSQSQSQSPGEEVIGAGRRRVAAGMLGGDSEGQDEGMDQNILINASAAASPPVHRPQQQQQQQQQQAGKRKGKSKVPLAAPSLYAASGAGTVHIDADDAEW